VEELALETMQRPMFVVVMIVKAAMLAAIASRMAGAVAFVALLVARAFARFTYAMTFAIAPVSRRPALRRECVLHSFCGFQ
jgi:hypothetical protein